MKTIPTLITDFYKVSHRAMMQEGTTHTLINMTARSNKYATKLEGVDDGIILAGVQGFKKELEEMFEQHFFDKFLSEVKEEYSYVIRTSLGVEPDTKHIEDLWKLRYLPLQITSLEEGKLIPIKVPFIQIVNTDERFAWLPTYIETYMSSYLWQMITNATTAFQYRVLFERAAKKDGTDPFSVKIQGHDFSMRGLACPEASRNGFGHLLSFLGTDTIPAIIYANEYYDGKNSQLVGCSVPASEHSIMTQRGVAGEEDVFKHIVGKAYPTGIVSVVADSFNLWNFIEKIMVGNKELIMNRQPASNGLPAKVVVRPDSGDPVEILCGIEGFDNGENRTPEQKGVVELLWENFGGTVNDKGYKVLDSHVGVIYGDSITLERAKEIIRRLHDKGFASGNVVYGIGSYTYQVNSRDTHGMAAKSTATRVVTNGEAENRVIFKDPITDSGTKKSAKGLLSVVEKDGKMVLEEISNFDLLEYSKGNVDTGLLQVRNTSLNEIRDNVEAEVVKFI